MASATQTGNASQPTHGKAATLSNPIRSAHSGSPSGKRIGEHSTSSSSPMPKQKVSRNKELVNFIVQWTCGILAAAAAIVFGIWAPLSYEATASGNHSNDAAQSSMVDALSSVGDMAVTANSIGMTAASIARSAATAQSYALLEMQNRLAMMGQLAVIDFCITQSTLAVCSSYIQNANLALTSLIDTLGAPTRYEKSLPTFSPNIGQQSGTTWTLPTTVNATSTSAIGTTTATQPSFPARAAPPGPVASVGAILGIVFGSMIAVGAILAFFTWRYRYACKLSRQP